MNKTVARKILQTVNRHKRFLISAHVNPDPDAVGTELALYHFLRSRGKSVTIVHDEAVARRLHFLPGAKVIKSRDEIKHCRYDAAFVVDCGDIDRIGVVRELLDPNKPLINLDHHITNTKFGSLNLVEAKSSSSAELLFEFLRYAKCRITKNIAFNIYVGIMTDTGSFRFENTTDRTHAIVSELVRAGVSPTKIYQQVYETMPLSDMQRFARVVSRFTALYGNRVVSLDLSEKELDHFSEDFDLRDMIFKFLRSISGVDVFVIFSQVGRSETRVNFRSSGRVDVAKIAYAFDGGGHKNASGCTINASLPVAKRKILNRIRKAL